MDFFRSRCREKRVEYFQVAWKYGWEEKLHLRVEGMITGKYTELRKHFCRCSFSFLNLNPVTAGQGPKTGWQEKYPDFVFHLHYNLKLLVLHFICVTVLLHYGNIVSIQQASRLSAVPWRNNLYSTNTAPLWISLEYVFHKLSFFHLWIMLICKLNDTISLAFIGWIAIKLFKFLNISENPASSRHSFCQTCFTIHWKTSNITIHSQLPT